MTAFDTKFQRKLVRLERKLGFTVTVTAESSYIYDETTGEATIETDPVTATMLPPGAVTVRYSAFNTAQEGDTQGVFVNNSLGFTPAQGMHVTFGGATYAVPEVQEIRTGERIALWVCLLRKVG